MDLRLLLNPPPEEKEVGLPQDTPQAELNTTGQASAIEVLSHGAPAWMTEQDPSPATTRKRSRRSKPLLGQLYLNEKQKDIVQEIYQCKKEYRKEFDAADQVSAVEILHKNGLFLKGWRIVWSNKWDRKSRVGFQCPSGYSTEARQQKEQKHCVTQGEGAWLRKTPCIFTGCLAHADITVERVAKEVKRIVGWFDHVEGCELAREITEGVGGETTKEELDEFWRRIAPEGPRGLRR